MRTILILSLFSAVLFNCKSQQHTFANLPEAQLIFGRGGGITGEVTSYTLLENGQLFYTNTLTKEQKQIKSVPKKEAAAYFLKMKELQLSEMEFNHPGNLYYFIEEVQGDEKHRVTWGSANHQISDDCIDFYEELRTAIK